MARYAALKRLGKFTKLTNKLHHLIGDTNATLFYEYLVDFVGYQKDPDGWIYKTVADIQKDIRLSAYKQRKARRLLLRLGLIEEQLRGVPPVLFFRASEQALERFLERTPPCDVGNTPIRKLFNNQLSNNFINIIDPYTTSPYTTNKHVVVVSSLVSSFHSETREESLDHVTNNKETIGFNFEESSQQQVNNVPPLSSNGDEAMEQTTRCGFVFEDNNITSDPEQIPEILVTNALTQEEEEKRGTIETPVRVPSTRYLVDYKDWEPKQSTIETIMEICNVSSCQVDEALRSFRKFHEKKRSSLVKQDWEKWFYGFCKARTYWPEVNSPSSRESYRKNNFTSKNAPESVYRQTERESPGRVIERELIADYPEKEIVESDKYKDAIKWAWGLGVDWFDIAVMPAQKLLDFYDKGETPILKVPKNMNIKNVLGLKFME